MLLATARWLWAGFCWVWVGLPFVTRGPAVVCISVSQVKWGYLGHDDLHPGDTPTEHPVFQHLCGWGGLRVGGGRPGPAADGNLLCLGHNVATYRGSTGVRDRAERGLCPGPPGPRFRENHFIETDGMRWIEKLPRLGKQGKNLPEENTEEESARSREEDKP